MSEIVEGVNWLAVAVGAVVSFILGWLWYSPKLFGEAWAKGVGIKLNTDMKPPVAAMVTQATGTFLLAWFVGVTAAKSALLTLVLAFVAFLFLSLSQGLFANKGRQAILIEQGYIFVMLIVMIVFQGVF